MKNLFTSIIVLAALVACHPQEPKTDPTWVTLGFSVTELNALTWEHPAILQDGDTLINIQNTLGRAFECYLPGEIIGQAFVRVSDSSGGVTGLVSEHKAGDRRLYAHRIEIAAIPRADSVFFDAEVER